MSANIWAFEVLSLCHLWSYILAGYCSSSSQIVGSTMATVGRGGNSCKLHKQLLGWRDLGHHHHSQFQKWIKEKERWLLIAQCCLCITGVSFFFLRKDVPATPVKIQRTTFIIASESLLLSFLCGRHAFTACVCSCGGFWCVCECVCACLI